MKDEKNRNVVRVSKAVNTRLVRLGRIANLFRECGGAAGEEELLRQLDELADSLEGIVVVDDELDPRQLSDNDIRRLLMGYASPELGQQLNGKAATELGQRLNGKAATELGQRLNRKK